jgi:hypothetical protein
MLSQKGEPEWRSRYRLGYSIDNPGFELEWGQEIFLLSITSRLVQGPARSPIQWVLGILGVEWLGHYIDYWPASSAKVNECSHTSGFLVCLHVLEVDSFMLLPLFRKTASCLRASYLTPDMYIVFYTKVIVKWTCHSCCHVHLMACFNMVPGWLNVDTLKETVLCIWCHSALSVLVINM